MKRSNSIRKYLSTMGLLAALTVGAQKKIDSSYNNTYYQGRIEWFQGLGGQKGAIVFLGNSITERGQWHELLPGKKIMNRGIGGDNTFGVLARLDSVILYQPSTIFLLIGINDLGRGLPIPVIANNYQRIVSRIRKGSPKTKLVVQSVLPMNEAMLKAEYLKNKQDSVKALNQQIRTIALAAGATYLDLHPLFSNEKGELKEEWTMDGIHLRPVAYVEWARFLKAQKLL